MKKYEQFEVVSFDLYGTLVKRLVDSPECVFKILEKRFFMLYGRNIEKFAEKRMAAEKQLYSQKKCSIDLEAIYNNINDLSETDRYICKQLEEEIEYDVSYPNKEGISLYKFFAELNKKIIIVSDMYLSQELIQRIICKCGIDNIFRVYISGCEGCSKANNGKLYQKVCRDLQISPSKMLHIGDNIKSDILNAYLNRVRSIYIKNRKSLSIEEFAKNTSNICSNADEKIGYVYFGALTLAYISWIYSKCKEHNIHVLYFFAREGWIFKKIFDSLYGNAIRTKYLYVSRRSLSIPQLQTCNCFEDIKEIIYLDTPTMTVSRFLYELGINEEDVALNLEKNDINLNDELKNVKDKDLLYKLIESEVKKVSCEQFEYAREYLLNAIDNSETVAGIVDIGWTGTMQNNFIKMLRVCDVKQEIIGFFIGQRKTIKKYLDSGMHNFSFLFDYKDDFAESVISSGTGFLELVYSAPHGTTLGYSKVGPQLASDNMSASTIRHFLAIQEGILLYIKKIHILQKKYEILSKEQVLEQLINLFKSPPLQLLDYIGEWEDFENCRVRLAHKIEGISVNFFCKEFIKSGWSVGFLKRNIRLPFPYYSVFNLLRKARHLKKRDS